MWPLLLAYFSAKHWRLLKGCIAENGTETSWPRQTTNKTAEFPNQQFLSKTLSTRYELLIQFILSQSVGQPDTGNQHFKLKSWAHAMGLRLTKPTNKSSAANPRTIQIAWRGTSPPPTAPLSTPSWTPTSTPSPPGCTPACSPAGTSSRTEWRHQMRAAWAQPMYYKG